MIKYTIVENRYFRKFEGISSLRAMMAGKGKWIPSGTFRVDCRSEESAWESGRFEKRVDAQAWINEQVRIALQRKHRLSGETR